MRPHPEAVLQTQRGYDDPDQKIIAMLDARRLCEPRGKGVAKPKAPTDEDLTISVR